MNLFNSTTFMYITKMKKKIEKINMRKRMKKENTNLTRVNLWKSTNKLLLISKNKKKKKKRNFVYINKILKRKVRRGEKIENMAVIG